MNYPDEQSLINGAKSYDLSVLGMIYDRYSPLLYRYAMRLLGDDTMAEDCVAETFSRFLKSLQAGQGPKDHLQAYLFRITHNLITDAYRKQAPLSLELHDSLPDDDRMHPENQTDALLQKHQIHLALKSLTPDQRLVVSLRFLEGWNHEEISAVIKKPVGAVRALQLRALNKLRDLLLMDKKENSYGSR